MASASVAGSRFLPFLLKLLLFIVFYHSNWHPTEDSPQSDYWFSVIPIKIPWTLLTQLRNKRLILKSLREHQRPLRHKAVWNKNNLAEGNTMPDSKTHSRNMVKWADKQTRKRYYYIGIILYHQRAIVIPEIKLHLKQAAPQQTYQNYILVKGQPFQ